MNACKLTNGYMVLRAGETLRAGMSPSGYRWTLENKTKRPFRMAVGSRMALGQEEWVVKNDSGRAILSWDCLHPEFTEV